MQHIFSKIRIALIAAFLSAPSFLMLRAETLDNPLKYDSIPQLISAVVDQLLTVAGIVAVIFIIYSGFLFVKAAGNESEIEKAKKTFFYTIIGVAVLLGATAISKGIEATINSLRK